MLPGSADCSSAAALLQPPYSQQGPAQVKACSRALRIEAQRLLELDNGLGRPGSAATGRCRVSQMLGGRLPQPTQQACNESPAQHHCADRATTP